MVTLEGLYNQVMEKPLRILEIFNDFFGESRVDMQGFIDVNTFKAAFSTTPSFSGAVQYFIDNNCDGGFILVRFPYVKVTNEYGKHTDVYDLFAKISIRRNGTILGGFTLNRAKYTKLHISNNYMHSHVSQIPFNDFTVFQRPCTGTGPINSTIYTLSEEFDEDIWRLFCLELDKYVQVESIAGVPYHRLESLSLYGDSRNFSYERLSVRGLYPASEIARPKVAEFLKYLIDKEVFKFSYNSGGYNIAMSTTETIIKVSNAFIDWYNEQYRNLSITITRDNLLSSGILVQAILKNNKLHIRNSERQRDFSQYVGKLVCTFKGQPVRVSIIDNDNSGEENALYILNSEIIKYIVTTILKVVNFRYGNKNDEESAASGETILYL